jgi:hypothetical protein
MPWLPPELVSAILGCLSTKSLFVTQQINSIWYYESQRVLRRRLQEQLDDRLLLVSYDRKLKQHDRYPEIIFTSARHSTFHEYTLPSRITLKSLITWTKPGPVDLGGHIEIPSFHQVGFSVQRVLNWILTMRVKMAATVSPLGSWPDDVVGQVAGGWGDRAFTLF